VISLCDLREQYEVLKSELDHVILGVAQSGHYILGAELESLESECSAFFNGSYAIGVANGSDALYLSLKALDIGKGDKVITTPFTFIATVEAIARCGATPVFVDVDSSGNMNLDMLDNASKSCRCVIPVHLYGNPVDMTKLLKLAKENEFWVVEDACQSFAGKWRNQRLGTFGIIGCYSFYPSKIMAAMGDSGLVVTNDKGLAETIRQLRNHGLRNGLYDKHGINSRLDEIQAAVLRVKLKYVDEWIVLRKKKAELYDSMLGEMPISRNNEGHAWNYYTILAINRDSLRAFLGKNGIATAIYYSLPLHLQKVYSDLGYKKGDFPMAELLSQMVISLPLYPELSDNDIIFVCQKVKEFYDSVRCKVR